MPVHELVGPLPFSSAYCVLASSSMRQGSWGEVGCERLRARRKLGTAMAARRAMIATTIMISTSVKPDRRDWSLESIVTWMMLLISFGGGGWKIVPAIATNPIEQA